MEGLLGNSQFKDVFLRLQKEYLEHAAKTGYLDFDPEIPIAYTKAIKALEENEAYRQIIQQLHQTLDEGVSGNNATGWMNGMQAAVDLLDSVKGATCSTEKE